MTSGQQSQLEPAAQQPLRWGVIGGGMLGLVLAERLALQGQRVALYEASDRLGGLASPWQVGELTWDRFYHVTLLSDQALRGLLRRLALEEELQWVTTRTGFYTDGELYSLSNSWEFLRFPPLNLLQKIRLGGTIFYASKIRHWQRLERMTVESWLRRWSGTKTFEKIWLPLLRAKLGTAYSDASAAFIWSYIARMYKARRSGLKTEMFGYLPGGYQRVLAAMRNRLETLGVEIHCDSPLQHLQQAEANKFLLQFHHGRQEQVSRVITTLPSPLISQTCSALTQFEHQRHRQLTYLGVICLSLVLRKPLSPYYVTNITDASIPMTAVIEMTNIVPPQQFGGSHLIYLPKYLPSAAEGWDESDDQLYQRFTTALQQMHPGFNQSQDVLAWRIARARQVMAIPTLDYSNNLAAICTSIPGLYALNSAQIVGGTLNVNETIELAEQHFRETIWPDHQGLMRRSGSSP